MKTAHALTKKKLSNVIYSLTQDKNEERWRISGERAAYRDYRSKISLFLAALWLSELLVWTTSSSLRRSAASVDACSAFPLTETNLVLHYQGDIVGGRTPPPVSPTLTCGRICFPEKIKPLQGCLNLLSTHAQPVIVQPVCLSCPYPLLLHYRVWDFPLWLCQTCFPDFHSG